MRYLASIVVSIGLLTAAGQTPKADIYAFVDADGVTHFSNVPADERYELLLAAAVESNPGVDPRLIAKSAQYDPFIEEAAHAADVDAELLRAIIAVESGFDAAAVSRKGAQGLMQLMPATAQLYGVVDAFNARQNILGGARYLRDLIDRYDRDFELALAAYNAGEEAVDRYGRTIPPFAETRSYVPRVLRVYGGLRALNDSI